MSILCISYLLVDICPIVDQQLQTEGTVGGDGSQVQRGVAALIGLVNISSVVHQLGSHCLLPHVASNMEWSVSKSIGLINLTVKHKSDTRSDCAKSLKGRILVIFKKVSDFCR